MSRVAALFIDPLGPYPDLLRETYDKERDARTYKGPHPIVAHPPCGPWGVMRHLCETHAADRWCGPDAIDMVRRWGGVLEHPRGSRLFHEFLPLPGRSDDYGFTIEVSQCDWGHVARKRTWLYIVGCTEFDLPERPGPQEPTHWASGSRTARKGPVPPGIKVCSVRQRNRTPIAFAWWLIEIASRCAIIPA